MILINKEMGLLLVMEELLLKQDIVICLKEVGMEEWQKLILMMEQEFMGIKKKESWKVIMNFKKIIFILFTVMMDQYLKFKKMEKFV